MALLTAEQRRWIDLQKIIKRQRPSKRPKSKPSTPWKAWCFDRAVSKHGWWSRCMTLVYLIHIIALMYVIKKVGISIDLIFVLGPRRLLTNQEAMIYEVGNSHVKTSLCILTHKVTLDYLFLLLTTIYTVDIAIRVTGLGWQSFSANGWNLFDIFVVAGSFSTTVPIVLGSRGFAIQQLQKLFLVSIAFKLVQKSNSLNQLFKTSVYVLTLEVKAVLIRDTAQVFPRS
jgi:voltage-dependent calcium channel